MSRVAALLTAVAAEMRSLRDADDVAVFRDVRVELDRYDLSDLVKESTQTPAARVCFLAGRPVARADAGRDLDVSVALVVVAGSAGRSDPDFASADMAALELLMAASAALMADSYCGLTKLTAAELGDQLVAVSQQSSKTGIAIAVLEVKWRLLDVLIARKAIQRAIESGREPFLPTVLTINGGPPEPRATDAEPGP